MITLKTLSKATAQEVFDQVTQHLLTQMQRSVNSEHIGGNGCMYRSGNLKCAAGCLIGDEEYSAELFEQNDWLSLLLKERVPQTHFDLIFELQKVHDHHLPPRWCDQLKRIAGQFNLQFNPPS